MSVNKGGGRHGQLEIDVRLMSADSLDSYTLPTPLGGGSFAHLDVFQGSANAQATTCSTARPTARPTHHISLTPVCTNAGQNGRSTVPGLNTHRLDLSLALRIDPQPELVLDHSSGACGVDRRFDSNEVGTQEPLVDPGLDGS